MKQMCQCWKRRHRKPSTFPPASKPLPPNPSSPKPPFPTTPKSGSSLGDTIKTKGVQTPPSAKTWQTRSIPKKPATTN